MAPNHLKLIAVAAVTSASAAGLWLVLAWRTPTSTFHFAPFIAAGVGPYVAKARSGRHHVTTAVLIVAASSTVVGIAIAALALGNRLRGPTFWSADGALAESVLFAVVGSAAGLAILWKRPSGRSVPHSD